MSLFDELENEGKVNVNDKVKQFNKRKIQLLKQIEEFLESRGWGMDDLAEEMEISEDELKDKLENPELEDLAKIESAFDQSLFTVKRNLGYELMSKVVAVEKIE